MRWGVSAELVGLAYIGDRNHFLIADQGSPPANAKRAEDVYRLLSSHTLVRSSPGRAVLARARRLHKRDHKA